MHDHDHIYFSTIKVAKQIYFAFLVHKYVDYVIKFCTVFKTFASLW